jgi:hypothetical protein
MAEARRALDARIKANGGRCDHVAETDRRIERRRRSLQYCHLPATQLPLLETPRNHNAYVPELAARMEEDPNLTDGARRCARIIAAYVYRRNRHEARAEITVSFLAVALRKCSRTIQRYLRQLERAGYIDTSVIVGDNSRMAVGLLIELLSPLLPRHKWPAKIGIPGATAKSQNYKSRYKNKPVPCSEWALRCMDGVFRSLMQTIPPLTPPPLLSS